MKNLEEQLKHLDKSTPALPLHSIRLRRALLASKQFEGSSFPFMTKLLPVGLVLALLMAFNALQAPDSTLGLTPSASAQEILSNVVTAFQALSDEEVDALNQRLAILDVGDLLLEARDATDLHLEDQRSFTKNPDGTATLTFGEEQTTSSQSTDLSEANLSVLAFTAEDDSQVAMVIDTSKDYLPSLIFVTHSEE